VSKRRSVSVVTVNHDGKRFLGPLLQSLRAQTYPPTEVLVVDNASSDDSVSFVENNFPEVRVLNLGANLGFVGGNNAGIRATRSELVALINNDTVAEPTWLEHLVEAASEDTRIGAVASKIVFLTRFVPIHLAVPTFSPRRLGMNEDSRELGVRLFAGSGFTACDYTKPIFKQGFYPQELIDGRPARWTAGRATLLLPIPEPPAATQLRLVLAGGSPGAPRELEVALGSLRIAALEVDGAQRTVTLPIERQMLEQESFDVINNAGTALDPNGDAADRAIYEPDRGQWDTPQDIEAFCGASVLLRREALERVGLFDRDFFMYYEDTDLSWRLRAAGYRLRYAPSSRLRHAHAASSQEWSPLYSFHTARNRILMIAKNASGAAFVRAYLGECKILLRAAVAGMRRRGAPADLPTRLRVQRSLIKQVPRAVLKRLGWLAH
jgi:GT2 family glycosyltransferase